VVTLPRREQLGLRHIEFLPLSGHQVLAVLVFEGQEVQNRILKVERPFTASELQQASNYLNTLFVGKGIHQVRESIVEEMRRTRAEMDALMRTAVELASVVFDLPDEADYVIAGQSNLMDFKELSDVEKLRALFDAFTAKREMLHLLDQALQGESAQIFIGEESGYRVLDDCSVVTAPYRVNGQVVGVLAVIGPTRMAYQRVIPIVDITARLLGSALNLSN
jgi:heat-inducible transcriptional repressor